VTVIIRPAHDGDAPVIGEMTERAYRVDGHLNGVDSAAHAVDLRDAASRVRAARVLVAVLDGAIVGSVTLAPFGSPYAEKALSGEMELRMLAVAPEARRRGIAEQLMTAAMEDAGQAGASRVVLCTEVSMTGAHRLYRRLGFTRQPERDWSPGEVRLLAYGRDLAPDQDP
jgi:ribosomal protein S18 acetylase RimI-like enzyme